MHIFIVITRALRRWDVSYFFSTLLTLDALQNYGRVHSMQSSTICKGVPLKSVEVLGQVMFSVSVESLHLLG